MTESAPEPRLEEQVLRRLGLERFLTVPVSVGRTAVEGRPVTGANFLDAYPENSTRVQRTIDTLNGFMATPDDDPDYAGDAEFLTDYLTAQFSSPEAEA